MNSLSLRHLALTVAMLTLVSPWAAAAVATLERVAGQPVIYEIGDAGARHVSLVGAGARYRLPIEIETGPADSAEFRLPDSTIQVAPGSIMRIAAPEARESGLFQRILQKAGSSLFAVDRRTVEHFEVETPYLVSVVKGTTFNVVVHEAGATVALHEGRLLVSTPDGTRQVELLPGDVAYADTAGALEKLSHHQARVGAPGADKPAPGGADEAVIAGIPTGLAGTGAADALGQTLAANHAQAAAGADLGVGGFLSGVDAGVGSGDLVAGIGDAAGSLGGTAGDLVGDVGGAAGDLIGDAGGSVGDLIGDAGGSVGDLVGDVGASAGDLVDGLTGSAGDLVGDVGGATGDLVADLGGATGELVGDLGGTVGDLVGGPTGDLVGEVGGATGDLVGEVGGATGDLVGGLGDTSGDLLQDAGDVTGGLIEDVGGGTDDLVEGVGGAVGGAVGGLGGGLLGGGLGL